jgi:UDP-N-acetylmuramyl pentapeptide phosphotransferase/UDP-N-acetylglucosamine-1-phosphate transferase
LLYFYIKIGSKQKIHDIPNERSSHSYSVIRGGGIILFLVNILMFCFEPSLDTVVLSVGLSMGVITGFVDDLGGLGTKLRFVLYLIATYCVLLAALPSIGFSLLLWIPLVVVSLGVVNSYNFMDGVNGITASYSIVLLSSSLAISYAINAHQFDLSILLYLAYFLAFMFFNFRKRALLFLGDSGSVTMGLFASFLVVYFGAQLHTWSTVLLLGVYGVDSVGTIVIRLLKKENVFIAHRSHLYQDLVHKMNWDHRAVSLLYAALQGVLSIGYVLMIHSSYLEIYSACSLVVLTLLYITTKFGLYGDGLLKKDAQEITG